MSLVLISTVLISPVLVNPVLEILDGPYSPAGRRDSRPDLWLHPSIGGPHADHIIWVQFPKQGAPDAIPDCRIVAWFTMPLNVLPECVIFPAPVLATEMRRQLLLLILSVGTVNTSAEGLLCLWDLKKNMFMRLWSPLSPLLHCQQRLFIIKSAKMGSMFSIFFG
jgi:hypothetical protein